MLKVIKNKMTLDFVILMNLSFNFIPLDTEFFLNPFYLLGMLSSVNLVFQILGYACPNFKRHQIIVFFKNICYQKKNCYYCGIELL